MATDRLSGRRPGLSQRSGLESWADLFLRPSAPRCIRMAELECHHKNRGGGNAIDNAQMLCKQCHEATISYGMPGQTPEPFSEMIKLAARIRCNGQCECVHDHANHGHPPPPVMQSL